MGGSVLYQSQTRATKGSTVKIQINRCTWWGELEKIKCRAALQILINKTFAQQCDISCSELGSTALLGSINPKEFFIGGVFFTIRCREEVGRWGKYWGGGGMLLRSWAGFPRNGNDIFFFLLRDRETSWKQVCFCPRMPTKHSSVIRRRQNLPVSAYQGNTEQRQFKVVKWLGVRVLGPELLHWASHREGRC